MGASRGQDAAASDMSTPRREKGHRILASGALISVIALWLLSGGALAGDAPETISGFAIAEHGRVSLARAELPDLGAVSFDLTLEDEGEVDSRSARIVAQDGRRIDTVVTRLAGARTRFRLEIEASFLRAGRYLVEVDAVDAHPLDLRRYVVEIAD